MVDVNLTDTYLLLNDSTSLNNNGSMKFSLVFCSSLVSKARKINNRISWCATQAMKMDFDNQTCRYVQKLVGTVLKERCCILFIAPYLELSLIDPTIHDSSLLVIFS